MKYFLFSFLFLLFFIQKIIAQHIEKSFAFLKDFSETNYLSNTILIYTKNDNFIFSEKLKNYLGEIKIQNMLDRNKWKTKLKGKSAEKFLNIHFLTFSNPQKIENVINLIKKENDVLLADPVYTNYKQLFVPNDPLAQPTVAQYHLQKIQAYQAWDISTGDPNVLIGIIDNGATLTNADLNGNQFIPVGVNLDVADNDNDVTGGIHGDMVALCASAVPNNNFGSVGTGYNCKFIPVKVAPNSNLVSYTSTYEGVLLAADVPNCKVINMSWGRVGIPSTIEYLILDDIANTRDISLVAAAGNDNSGNKYYPASYDGLVISVTASNASDTKASFSTFNNSVDIFAPGDQIVSAVGTFGGTSFASPIVAGAIGLMRSYYPTLNRKQIEARLLSTTDDVYNLTPNAGFVGLLGKGRLNMFRSLNDPFFAVGLNNYQLPTGTRNYLFGGQTSNLVCNFQNHLNALSNMQVTISSNSPFLTIVDGQSNIGNVNGNTSFNNNSDVFVIKAANNTPNNTPVILTFQYNAGTFTYTESINMILNPGIIDINDLSMNVSDEGTFSVFGFDFPYEKTGLTYKEDVMLTQTGLMLGIGADTVSNSVRSVNATTTDDNFTTLSSTKVTTITSNYMETTTTFTDAIGNIKSIGLEVTQKSYAWNFTALKKAIALEFQIKNNSSRDISSLFAGMFADWDIQNFTQNKASWDETNQMGYVWNVGTTTRYGGVVLLTNRPLPNQKATFRNYFAFNNDTTASAGVPSFIDGYTTSDKFITMSGQPFCTSSCASATKAQAGEPINGSNVSYLVSSKLSNLKIGEIRSVAFAFVTADNLAELQANAQAIRTKFREIKTGTQPLNQTLTRCKGESITIIPSVGNRFNYYTEIPSNPNATPIASGSSLLLQNLTTSTTIYVTNIDQIYESDFATIQVNVSGLRANFSVPTSPITTSVPQTFTQTSVSANSYDWSFKLGTNNSNANVIFGNGTNNNSPSPQVSFLQSGTYRVRLRVNSSAGCVDSLVVNINVVIDLTTNLENWADNLQIYPNPTRFEKVFMTSPEIFGEQNISLLDNVGKELNQIKVFFEPDKPTEIPLQNLPSGIYFLRIKIGKGVLIRKIIVE
ncbi:MAG: T9SS C-terminal target domain-containing protein [Bacteroidetes bacterium]|nr:MAG: T9SS C-terminal target domain-containing protein [Bacteroidota bacterium]